MTDIDDDTTITTQAIAMTPDAISAMVKAVVKELTPKPPEKEPATDVPWALLDATPEVIEESLRSVEPFIANELYGRWGHAIPPCWFWHKPLTLSCIAIKDRYEGLAGMSASSVLTFFGYELYRYLDDTMIMGDGTQPPEGHPQHKKMTLDQFIESGWMHYIWCGDERPDQKDDDDAE